jgi:hypothetical protein
MRPYLVLMAVVLMAAFAFGQERRPVPRPVPHPFPRSEAGFYGCCGPYVPMLTTPEVSLQQFSPNPVGASNATTGLIAGATNSTLSEVEGNTSSVWTVGVWYQGGDAPLTSSNIHLFPEQIGREGQIVREAMPGAMREGGPREERSRENRFREESSREERGPRHSEEARVDWTYITGPSAAVSNNKKAAHVYTNDDVARENDKNGAVKYDGKTEKI